MKRIFDILLALALALPALVGVGLCWVLVRIDSAGPVIFKQIRVGRDGVFFTFYKIRTMRIETAELPSHEASASSVTRIGALLRPFKFDELPQIWNVIKGDMSFVGPRPRFRPRPNSLRRAACSAC